MADSHAPWRKTVDQEKSTDPFHDNESGDIFDLFNACNGVLHNGRLDIRKLDELGPEEAEVLDIPRLRKVWHHADSGCAQCEAIITTLNSARGRQEGKGKGSGQELAQAGNVSRSDLSWKR